MAINVVNIDEMLNMQRDFEIGGRKFTAHFNDKLVTEITEVQLRVTDLMNQIEKTPEEKQKELNNAPVTEQIKFVEEQISKVNGIVMGFFTKLFSADDAKWIYEHYNESTSALVAVLGIINQYSQDIVNESAIAKQKKYPVKNSNTAKFSKKHRK